MRARLHVSKGARRHRRRGDRRASRGACSSVEGNRNCKTCSRRRRHLAGRQGPGRGVDGAARTDRGPAAGRGGPESLCPIPQGVPELIRGPFGRHQPDALSCQCPTPGVRDCARPRGSDQGWVFRGFTVLALSTIVWSAKGARSARPPHQGRLLTAQRPVRRRWEVLAEGEADDRTRSEYSHSSLKEPFPQDHHRAAAGLHGVPAIKRGAATPRPPPAPGRASARTGPRRPRRRPEAAAACERCGRDRRCR